MVIHDTSDGRGIMCQPDLREKENHGRCFADELLIGISVKYPKPVQAQPAKEQEAKAAEPARKKS